MFCLSVGDPLATLKVGLDRRGVLLMVIILLYLHASCLFVGLHALGLITLTLILLPVCCLFFCTIIHYILRCDPFIVVYVTPTLIGLKEVLTVYHDL